MVIPASTDISHQHWTQRILPPGLRPYALLFRMDRPIGIWLLLLPGLWAIMLAGGGPFLMGTRGWLTVLLFAVGAVVMRGAGCIVNDLWDREIDRNVARTQERPLASGALSPRQAMIALGVLLALGFLILVQFNFLTIILGVLSLPLIVLYPLMKRWTFWPQLFLGIVFNFGALMGWSAMTGRIDPPALLLYASCIFWTLGYDTIYAHQDREGDIATGVKSTALRLGRFSRAAVTGFYGLHLFLLTAALTSYELYFSEQMIFSYGFLALLLLPVVALAAIFRLQRWDPASPQSSLQAFRENRVYGLVIAVLCAAVAV